MNCGEIDDEGRSNDIANGEVCYSLAAITSAR